MRLLELFSGTHSIGKVAEQNGFDVISLDRDMGSENAGYRSNYHIKEDIMTWDYKQFSNDYFDVITASPVCLFWSKLRYCWIGRKSKSINPDGRVVTREDIERDKNLYGKPMVDKIFEILEYFCPMYYWIENPATGTMKDYIASEYPDYNNYYDVDYCMYSDWGYKKRTRFWTNIDDFNAQLCNLKCGNMENGQHNVVLGNGYELIDGKKVSCNSKAKRDKLRHKKSVDGGGVKHGNLGKGSTTLDRYRIPPKLIQEFFNAMEF